MPIQVLDLDYCHRSATPSLVGSFVLASLLLLPPTRVSTQNIEVLGSRALGMAGAFVAVADDATATYWNPAGLATGPLFDLVLERQEGNAVSDGRDEPLDLTTRASGGTSLNFALGTPPLGLTYYRIRATSFPSDPTAQSEAGGQTVPPGTTTVRTLKTQNLGVTFVQSLVANITLGTTLRIVWGTAAAGQLMAATAEDALEAATELPGQTATTIDLDAGALAAFGPWRAGIVGRNLRRPAFELPPGSGVHELRLERQVRAGFAFAPRSRPAGTNGPMTVAVDLDLRRVDTVFGARRELAVGAERWWLAGRVGARAGVRFNTLTGENQRGDPVVAAGFSVSPRAGSLIEGQFTRSQNSVEQGWGISTRVTF
jgi:F plasmid transfer operon, TraF, protein